MIRNYLPPPKVEPLLLLSISQSACLSNLDPMGHSKECCVTFYWPGPGIMQSPDITIPCLYPVPLHNHSSILWSKFSLAYSCPGWLSS